ncbi:hypothetical protein KJ853_03450, partial [Patescibacteria group bacterium]|nr:hypothetical protein [Patescibacteria group bacterium]
NSKPHHSFHILVLGSITGRVNFEGDTKLKDVCRVGWGRVIKKIKNQKSKIKILVEYQPLVENKTLKLGTPKQKEIFWDKNLIPKIKIGDWVSFHWNYLVQVLSTSEMANLKKYTLNTLKSL